MKLLREPLVHFLLLGAVLFGVFALVGERTSERTGHIVVTPGHLEHLTISFTRTRQRPPTVQELAGLMDDYIREEVLYREAVAMGLDRDDTIVRRRLRQKLEFLTEAVAETAPPSEDILGVGFSQAVARQVPLTAIMMVSPPLMCAGGNHVSPRGIIKLDCDGVNAYATLESAPSTGAGLVELRDCHDAIVWTPHRCHVSGSPVGPEGRHARTALI